MREVPDQVYATADGVDLTGDLYLPPDGGPHPLLVALPGGAWRVCRKGDYRQWAAYLCARGYGVFAIDYRLATPTRKAFPEAVHDVVAAVRYIRARAGELGIDAARIGLLGASAGAHLAALAALAHDFPAFAAGHPQSPHASVDASVKALVAIYGIHDLRRQWEADLALNPGPDANVARNLIGADPYEDAQAYFDASPIRHVGYARNRMPVFVGWGTRDEWVAPEQSARFVRALQQARFNVRTHQVEGASHFWMNQPLDDPSAASAKLAPRLIDFLTMAL